MLCIALVRSHNYSHQMYTHPLANWLIVNTGLNNQRNYILQTCGLTGGYFVQCCHSMVFNQSDL